MSLHRTCTRLLLAASIALNLMAAHATEPAKATANTAIKPLATVRQLMIGIVIPTSDVVFRVANDEEARDDASWSVVESNAWSLAESGMLLKIGPRVTDEQHGARVSPKDQAQWLKFAQQLIDTATATARLAAAKDHDKVVEAGFAVYDVCDGCHQRFMAARAGER